MTTGIKRGPIVPRLGLHLAMADLRHERLLCLCLVLAFSAIIAPLLLLFGLKYGTIETLRSRLVRDPAKREIALRSSVPHSREWLAQLTQRPDVGFVIPMTRQIANDVTVIHSETRGASSLALLPTAQGDPLLVEHHIPIPDKGEAVLSALAADDLGVTNGNTILVQVEATRGAASIREQTPLRVVGILPKGASGLRALYSTLPLLEAVEAFKDGLAVPDYGWPGGDSGVPPAYDGVVILSGAELGEEVQLRLLTNTGLGSIARINPPDMLSRVGWQAAGSQFCYLLENHASTIGVSAMAEVRERLRGLHADATPWVRPIPIALSLARAHDTAPAKLAALPESDEVAAKWQVTPHAPGGATPSNPGDAATLFAALPGGQAETGTLHLAEGASVATPFAVNITPLPGAQGSLVLAPAAFAGFVRRAMERTVSLAADGRTWQMQRSGYPAFRLYARSIDDVDSLRKHLEGQGLNVSTESQRISEVSELDRHLTWVFSLVAVVGIGGGLAALVASLNGSVERKRRELAILRLLGLPRERLIEFPLWQSLAMMTAGFALALAAFFAISTVVDKLFGDRLGHGESFCRLPWDGAAFAFAGSLICAAAAAIIAGFRAMRADPAEVLREE